MKEQVKEQPEDTGGFADTVIESPHASDLEAAFELAAPEEDEADEEAEEEDAQEDRDSEVACEDAADQEKPDEEMEQDAIKHEEQKVEYSEWTQCTKTCGSGYQYRYRELHMCSQTAVVKFKLRHRQGRRCNSHDCPTEQEQAMLRGALLN